MGVVAVPRDIVLEWFLPEPFITDGVAVVGVDCLVDALAELSADCPMLVSALGSVVVSSAGDVVVEPFGSTPGLPSVAGSAEVVFDNAGSSLSGRLTAATALFDIYGQSPSAVVISGVAGVLVVASGVAAPLVVGDAELEFEYLGDGDFPVFPFKLPLLFSDRPRNVSDGDAYVGVSGVGDVGVAGVAAADVVLSGDVGLVRKGSTPIFPFELPMVFDDLPANVNLGSAIVALNAGGGCVVSLVGESAVSFVGGVGAYGSGVFPWAFPVVLVAA